MININQVDDDLNDLAKASLNQRQNVMAAGTAVPTSVSDLNLGTGTVANPGPSGFGGATRPGRRTYNPLSKLSSYTYNITLYMVTPAAYNAFVESGRQNINAFSMAAGADGSPNALGQGAYILAQSGGINNTTTKRAPGFELDFYIDNLSINTLCNSKTTQTSTGAVNSFSFQISEPYGFSFITNLRKAGIALASSVTNDAINTNDLKRFFIIGIRFYGYDKDGNIVKRNSVIGNDPIDLVGNNADSEALFENFYDIQIQDIKFKLDGKTTVYTVTAVSTTAQTLLGIKRGRLPTGAHISGRTVYEALIGPNGLFTQLNKQQLALKNANPPSITYVNNYSVKFYGGSNTRVGNARIITDSDLNKWRWGGAGGTSTKDANDAKGNTPPASNDREIVINNDTSIISAIDTIIKKSTFMEDALSTVYKNTTEPDYKQKNYEQAKHENPTDITWYTVSVDVVNPKWDPKVNDWAYDIIYKIALYDIPSLESPYTTKQQRYYGAHKRYDYWFTGKNSEVIDFSLTFNNLYFNAVLGIENPNTADDAGNGTNTETGSGASTNNTAATSNNKGLLTDPPPAGKKDNAAGTATAGGTTSVAPQQKTGGDRTGGLGTSLEAQNSVMTYLTSPDAFSSASIRILGDPDFLIRDAISTVNDIYNKFYDTNGYTISAQGGQIFVEVAFKEAVDYDDKTGLMNINENILFINYPPYIKDMVNGAVIFMASEVKSTFNGGKFEQQIKMLSPTFDGIGAFNGPPAQNPSYIPNKPNGPVNDDTTLDVANYKAPTVAEQNRDAGTFAIAPAKNTGSIFGDTQPVRTFGPG